MPAHLTPRQCRRSVKSLLACILDSVRSLVCLLPARRRRFPLQNKPFLPPRGFKGSAPTLLQGCYNVATRLLQRCYKVATTLLQGCYSAATPLRQPVALRHAPASPILAHNGQALPGPHWKSRRTLRQEAGKTARRQGGFNPTGSRLQGAPRGSEARERARVAFGRRVCAAGRPREAP
jgi:hypothetical protein